MLLGERGRPRVLGLGARAPAERGDLVVAGDAERAARARDVEHLDRLRPLVHEVAGEDQRVARRAVAVEQLAELVGAPVDVADDHHATLLGRVVEGHVLGRRRIEKRDVL
jgi:hypothetical protein